MSSFSRPSPSPGLVCGSQGCGKPASPQGSPSAIPGPHSSSPPALALQGPASLCRPAFSFQLCTFLLSSLHSSPFLIPLWHLTHSLTLC